MKGLINIQVKDNECFRWCLVRYLNHVSKNPTKIGNFDKEFAKKHNFKGMRFPVHKKILCKTQKNKMIFPLVCLVLKIKHYTVIYFKTNYSKPS